MKFYFYLVEHVGGSAGSLGFPLGISGAQQDLFEHDATRKRVVRVGDSVFIPDVNVPDRYLKLIMTTSIDSLMTFASKDSSVCCMIVAK